MEGGSASSVIVADAAKGRGKAVPRTREIGKSRAKTVPYENQQDRLRCWMLASPAIQTQVVTDDQELSSQIA